MPDARSFRVEVSCRDPIAIASEARALAERLAAAGLGSVSGGHSTRLFDLHGAVCAADVERAAQELLADPVAERWRVVDDAGMVSHGGAGPSVDSNDPGLPHSERAGARRTFEVHLKPGVMDPVAESTLAELRAAGFAVESVRTARRYELRCDAPDEALHAAVLRTLANECIEDVVLRASTVSAPPVPPRYAFQIRRVALRELDDAGLESLSRRGHLFLSLDEMRAIQEHYRGAERDPTDLELETLAQTWSEHCVHKTLKSAVVYRGAAMPVAEDTEARRNEGTEARRDEVAIARRVGEVVAEEGEVVVELRYGNLLRDTIARATRELIAAGRGPECLSVFRDNAGIIAFDERLGVAFKVETHNHPSAIEPYGGAATGVGGCIRDVIGCGLGARPIANTDVFCVAPGDWPIDALPHGVLHPARVLREVVRGVADYGNRMGIPTVNGAVHFDPRYLGNPLVYCGCVGLIPRERIEKGARPGDRIILLGGRTGRDGIHGATFSSAELTGGHADEFSHAVQIGNAITEKRILDAVLRARDAAGGCLYSAITDCGAGGLSSAVGEMGAEVGARVELGDVPLKYAGLRYDEIWISEAQERMVLAVPPQRLDALLAIAREEEVEATVIGDFGERDGQGRPRLVVCFAGQVVGELDMRFLHEGIPRRERQAEWRAVTPSAPSTTRPASRHAAGAANDALARLTDLLADPTIASKEWLIRRYDHEVQGGSVVKPLCGIGGGPSDAAVLRPRLDSNRGIAIGCGLAPHLSDVDPYWMAVDSIDEAIRNVVSVGGDPARIALLDNFCWGRTDDPRQMGALVRACQACCDAATAFGAPFISGKDSLNNHFALEPAETDRLAALISDATAARGWLRFGPPGAAERIAEQVRRSGRLSIPPTLLISAIALIDDVERCLTADLKRPGYEILLIGGFVLRDFSFAAAAAVHHAVAAMIRDGLISACHDVDLGGWLTALAEMAIAGDRGVEVIDAGSAVRLDPFDECAAGYLVESSQTAEVRRACAAAGVDVQPIARVRDERLFTCGAQQVPLEALRRSWQRLAQG